MTRFATRSASLLAASMATLALAACGGGGGGTPTPTLPPVVVAPPPAPTPVEAQYTPGEFKPSSEFRNICNPSGEKQFLRSFTNETYLWFDEVADRDPTVASESVGDYFDQLRTFRTTASGRDVDEFHFTQSTEEFERSRAGQSFGYGMEFVLLRSAPEAPGTDPNGNGVRDGRLLRVAYVLPGEAAADAGIARGATITAIDGVDVAFGDDVATLNDGLFPDTDGETHTFTYILNGETEERTATLEAGTIQENPVLLSKVVDTDAGGKTAYVVLNTFSPFTTEEALFDTFTELETQNVTDLVLDLRYNGGGLLAVACQLGYMIVGAGPTAGRTCDQLQYNSKIAPEAPFPFFDEGVGFTVAQGTPLPTLDLDGVTVLSTNGTCSASEAVINSLNGVDADVRLIGDVTCGKPYGFRPESNCGTTYFTVQFRGVNNKGFGDYADGFVPSEIAVNNNDRIKGCFVEDDFDFQLGDVNEPLFATALSYDETRTCPVATSAKTAEVGAKLSLADAAELSGGIIDPRPGALGQEPRIILQRLREAGLLLDEADRSLMDAAKTRR